MKFNIRLGIPEMLELWTDLQTKKKLGTLSNNEDALYRKWGQAMAHLSQNPQYPGLHSHEIAPLSKRYGMKVWQSYLENKTSSALRMYWVYGPQNQDITIIGLEPHPEDGKHGGYSKVTLSGLP